MSPYSESSEAVDNHLSLQITELRQDMRDGFKRQDDKWDQVVLKGEFNATVQRLDAKDQHLESKMDTSFSQLEAKLNAGFATIAGRDADRDRAAEKRDEERDKKFARRMTWTLTAVGLAWTVAQFFIAPLLQK